MNTLAIGTCRVYEPARAAAERGLAPWATARHRFHTIGEIEMGLDYLTGSSDPGPGLLHTLSDYALTQILDGDTEALERRRLETRLAKQDRFIIEISSPREHYATADGGGEVQVNQLVAHALAAKAETMEPFYRSGAITRLSGHKVVIPSRGARIAGMRRIRQRLAHARVLWVSHANVVAPSPAEEGLHALRRQSAETVAAGAAALGDDFFDPTEIVAAHGRGAVFKEDGADLGHFTPFALGLLADRYSAWIRS